MKTFKLYSLEFVENKGDEIFQREIPLIDGLIINREDEQNQWVIEAYMEKENQDLFHNIQQKRDTVMLQAKITKETNTPATFITSIVSINDIGEGINVIFIGTIVDQRKGIVKDMLKKLIEDGYQGESLYKKFKELIEED
ncbi:YwpF-like family protein [Virgibacillus sp. DJP39]|uniref:YwpF-like family protein n=1 Tax=Virgibacillus sp. DJP39 TaxID=3409790 RepID=UPI003BB792E5